MTMSAGRMAPLLTPVGVTRMRSPGRRTDRLPSHGGHESPLVEHASVVDDFFPMFAFGRHGYPFGGVNTKRAALWHPHSTSRCGAETIQIS